MANACIYIWLVWWACWLAVGFTAHRNASREPFAERAVHLVPLAAGCFLVLMNMGTGDTLAPVAIGGTLAGLLFAFWARLHLGRNWSGLIALKEGHELVRTGPYKFLRHPIYTGLLTAAWFTAASFNTPTAYVGVTLCTLACGIKINHEERFMLRAFGQPYQRMCGEVESRLIPGLY